MKFIKFSLIATCIFTCIISCSTNVDITDKPIDSQELLDQRKSQMEAELKEKLSQKISKQLALQGPQPSNGNGSSSGGGSTTGTCQVSIRIDNIEIGNLTQPNYIIGLYTPNQYCGAPITSCELFHFDITNNCPTTQQPWLDPACYPVELGVEPDDLDELSVQGDLNCDLDYNDVLSLSLNGAQFAEDCASGYADLDVTVTLTVTMCDTPGQGEYCVPNGEGLTISTLGGMCYSQEFTLSYNGFPESLDLQLGSGNLNDRCGCSFVQI